MLVVAYLVGEGEPERLTSALSARLPEHRVPAAYVSLPLTAHGPPEEALAALRAIGVERVGPSENFFELGRPSLLAVTLLARIRRHFDWNVPLRGIFAAPRLSAMAEVVLAAMSADVEPDPREAMMLTAQAQHENEKAL